MLSVCIAACLVTSGELNAQVRLANSGDTAENLEIHADVSDFDQATGVARASGEVIIKLGDVTIHADEAEFSQGSGIIRATGNVRLFKDEVTLTGEEIFYNTKTETATATKIKSALEPFFYETDSVVIPREPGQPIQMENAMITTHNSANPDYRVTARKLSIYPESRVVIRGARVQVGDRNIFGIPYFSQPLNSELGYMATPGWSSAWGGYALSRYGFMVGEDVLAHANLDYRTERGLAGGLEFWDQKFADNNAIGRLKLYYAHDNNPQIRFNGTSRSANVPNERYRVNLQHRVYLPSNEEESLFVDFDINKLSDAFMYEDFFQGEFRVDPKPDNLISATKLTDWGELSLVARNDWNDFFQTDERYEGAIDVIRTPIGNTGFFYDGFTSFGVLDEELGDDSLLSSFTSPISEYTRLATYHEVLMPKTIGGWLNVVPRAGIGYKNYSNFEIAGLGNVDQTIYHAGVDLSFKLSKRNPDAYNKMLGINGLMHVAKPYVSFSLTDVNEQNGRFNPIDRYTLTTRLRPIDMPLFTAVDSISDSSIIRSGLSNKWYTKRNGANYELLSVENYFETYIEDPEFNRQFSNFYTDVEFNPVPWVSLRSTAQLPLFDNTFDFTEIQSSAQFMPTKDFRFSVGHYYLDGHPFFQDANMITLSSYTRLSDDWGFSTSHRFEADDGVMEYQQYAIHKDIGSWVASVGGSIRDNRITDYEYGLFLSLTLKAFPKIRLPVDFDPSGGF